MKHTFPPYCLCFIFFFNLSNNSFGQAPGIEWQNSLGGNSTDNVPIVHQTSDGGYITAGGSYSGISGEKTVPHIGDEETLDIWIVKLDFAGNIEWQKNIGGEDHEYLGEIRQTADSGYIIASGSESDISGDKSEDNLGAYLTADCWIVKLDAAGNIEWDNTIGGYGHDFAEDIWQTTDGGYIVGAVSTSGISADKTEENIGGFDNWIIKLNSAGEIEWQNTIGGDNDDPLTTLIQTTDGGYFIGGYSDSGISGDKTEINITVDINSPFDYWVIKLNNSGEIEWQNTIGGAKTDYLREVEQTSDSGYILGGYSQSGIFADKAEACIGAYDYWIVKINSLGEIEWENTIGGSASDLLDDVSQTGEGGYIVCGSSSSGISGDKTEPYFDGFSDTDYWIIKLNAVGLIEWQNTIGGLSSDAASKVEQTDDGGFIVSGTSSSGISGDKTDPGNGSYDFWIIKLGCFAYDEICNSFDDNCNGLVDDDVIETITISADGPVVFCPTDSVILHAEFSGETVQWFKNGNIIPGATNAFVTAKKKGFYSCETYSNCDTVLSNTIFVNPLKGPPASIIADGPIVFCEGESVTLSANTGIMLSYQWYKNGELIPGANTINYLATSEGNYKCMVIKAFTGCYKMSNTISVTVPCKAGEWSVVSGETGFTIYPNPNNGTFILSAQSARSAGENIQIYNSVGQLIFTQQINSSDNNFSEKISLDNISSGIYFVRVGDGNNYEEQKLIIEK